jgi:general secretion pathway protein D
LHVYRVQNRTAAELAIILQSVLRSEDKLTAEDANSPEAQVAPRLREQVRVSSAINDGTGGPETPAVGLGSSGEASLPELTSDSSATREVAVANGVRVVADDANNSLLIFATDVEYQRILSVLEEIDSQPNQVLLEAVIAEVSLDDELKFGVRWLFGENRQNGTFSDIASGAVAQSFPGFSYFLRANDISLTLNALSSVTDVRVLSSPSLVVLDNKTAVLQVGDQVPIVTQSARGTTTSDAPIVNNVELKDTGVILSVTPRVNDSGRVILDIEQEVSTVVKTTTSGIDSPTIRQRKIKTSVVVTDGEALALGGMIQERETTGKAKVPILGDIPLLGNAFRQKTNSTARTELIIFIRPRVIRDMEEARRVTNEFQRELRVKAPRVRSRETTPAEEAFRILN